MHAFSNREAMKVLYRAAGWLLGQSLIGEASREKEGATGAGGGSRWASDQVCFKRGRDGAAAGGREEGNTQMQGRGDLLWRCPGMEAWLSRSESTSCTETRERRDCAQMQLEGERSFWKLFFFLSCEIRLQKSTSNTYLPLYEWCRHLCNHHLGQKKKKKREILLTPNKNLPSAPLRSESFPSALDMISILPSLMIF